MLEDLRLEQGHQDTKPQFAEKKTNRDEICLMAPPEMS
jgi:hypothetical protein